MEENLARATVDAASASYRWSLEEVFWASTVDTRYGTRTREAQHFAFSQWASRLLRERDEVRAQLAVAPPDEKALIENELDLLERDVAEKGPDRILRDLERRWSEREVKLFMAEQVQTLLFLAGGREGALLFLSGGY